ncbi:(3R)-3-hydroxyacyl-CoA dehydrogenase isoform X4 [Rissa tridactyla]|uniref:(3R)-3-hydroxyacyl-CoA dehydrogenase isoform X4 n=1 Tax=Rissa tridactyla TaxID=75485 RepID=UPI0023BAED0F|nr:(3R)-3-hydroxyacyl-CoA dehydrogenase isoform X4 [Rissa tridactyla]
MASAGRLGGAVALVTGGASGIGRAVCARLAREGARVAVADRDEAGAGDTVGGLHAGGGTPHAKMGSPPHRPHAAFGVDVASAPSVTQLLARVQEHFGAPPSVCVGCAGVTRDEFLLRLGEGDFQEVLGVNLTVRDPVQRGVAGVYCHPHDGQGAPQGAGEVCRDGADGTPRGPGGRGGRLRLPGLGGEQLHHGGQRGGDRGTLHVTDPDKPPPVSPPPVSPPPK